MCQCFRQPPFTWRSTRARRPRDADESLWTHASRAWTDGTYDGARNGADVNPRCVRVSPRRACSSPSRLRTQPATVFPPRIHLRAPQSWDIFNWEGEVCDVDCKTKATCRKCHSRGVAASQRWYDHGLATGAGSDSSCPIYPLGVRHGHSHCRYRGTLDTATGSSGVGNLHTAMSCVRCGHAAAGQVLCRVWKSRVVAAFSAADVTPPAIKRAALRCPYREVRG